MKVFVQIPISDVTGYGKDGIGLVTTLLEWDMDVYLNPTEVIPPVPAHIAQLLLKPPNPPYDLLIQHVDPMQLSIDSRLREEVKAAVAWTMWEQNSLKGIYNYHDLKERTSSFDLILGYSHNTVEAFKEADIPAQLLLGGYDSDQWKHIHRNWDTDNFSFCQVGKLAGRKSPELTIEAFRELKEEHPEFEPARLNMKTYGNELDHLESNFPPGAKLYSSLFSHESMKRFYGNNHVLISPSNGEGKNLPALEFMTTGGAVIATNWSGHRGWLGEYAYPLNYVLEEDSPGVRSARASKEHLKELMWHVFNNRQEVSKKGKLASDIIPQMLDWDKVVERLFMKISRLPNGRFIRDGALFARAQMEARREEARD